MKFVTNDVYKGFWYAVMEDVARKTVNAYICIPEGTKYYQVDRDSIPYAPPGGWTYNSNQLEVSGYIEHGYWLGWEYDSSEYGVGCLPLHVIAKSDIVTAIETLIVSADETLTVSAEPVSEPEPEPEIDDYDLFFHFVNDNQSVKKIAIGGDKHKKVVIDMENEPKNPTGVKQMIWKVQDDIDFVKHIVGMNTITLVGCIVYLIIREVL